MKYLKMIGLAAVAAMAMTAFTAGSASATTLEIAGQGVQNKSVTISASLAPGTSAVLRDTFGFSQNTCTTSTAHGATDGVTHSNGTYTPGVWTGYELRGQLSSLSFSNCTNEPVVVHKPGVLEVIHIPNTTNGTVTSSGAVVTTGSPFGTLTCETGAGTHIGTLTGTNSPTGHATLDVNAQFPCNGISSRWVATYTVTSPTGLGVVA